MCDAVVAVGELGHSDKSLIAYVVLSETAKLDVEAIREFLKARLPNYMLPAGFVVLAALPVNSNQKVDRRALPAPGPDNLAGLRTPVQARNDWEKQLVEIWEETFGISPIGIQNSFFDLGGDSLQAVQILIQIEERWHKTFPITVLMEAQSIEALAVVVRHGEGEKTIAEASVKSDVVPLRIGGSKPPLFCLHGVLLYQELAQCFDPEQPVYGVFLQEEVELLKTRKFDPVNSLFSSIPKIAGHYLESMRAVQPEGPYYLAGSSFGGLIAFEMGHQLRAAGEEVALVAMFDSWMIKKIPLHQRLKFHWDWFSKHGMTYLINRIGHRLERLGRRIGIMTYKLNKQIRPGEGSSPIISSEDLEKLLDEVSNEIERSYAPKPYSGKLVLFRAMDQGFFSENSPDLGWKPFATGEFEVCHIPGDHKGILRGASASIMARRLEALLG